MKKLLILIAVAITACTSHVKTEQQGKENEKEQENVTTAVPLNNGTKWRADAPTKKNVAAMVQVVNDSNYVDAKKREQLYDSLQTKIDTLIRQCRMQGAEHNALHVWLENVLKDMKELKEETNEYGPAYGALKEDIESFNSFFE